MNNRKSSSEASKIHEKENEGAVRIKHVKAHFKPVTVRHNGFVIAITKNRIEGFNSHLRERITLLKGFKNYDCMERYLEGTQIELEISVHH